jgi:hypothetical protein
MGMSSSFLFFKKSVVTPSLTEAKGKNATCLHIKGNVISVQFLKA